MLLEKVVPEMQRLEKSINENSDLRITIMSKAEDLTQIKDFIAKNGIKTELDPIVSDDWEGNISS